MEGNMNKFQSNLQKHPKLTKGIILGYIIFAGCFVFPFGNELFPFEFRKGYFAVVGYGIIGLGFAGVYGEHKEKYVYIASLILTALGMISRYIIEYGEVSNTMNFTPFNIISFIVVIPILIVVSYCFSLKYLVGNN